MIIRKLHRSAIALIALLSTTSPADAIRCRSATCMIDDAKLATGGAAWDKVQGSYEEGLHGKTPYKTWLDFRSYGMRLEVGRGADVRVRGYDGTTAWQSGSRGTGSTRDAAALGAARTTAWLSSNGFFFRDRFPADFVKLAPVQADGKAFAVIQATPAGGHALELWIDESSHLITRVVDRSGPSPVTVTASDYRPVGQVRIAFHLTETDADGNVTGQTQLNRVRLGAVARTLFAPAPSNHRP
jgi:hypothetical protein